MAFFFSKPDESNKFLSCQLRLDKRTGRRFRLNGALCSCASHTVYHDRSANADQLTICKRRFYQHSISFQSVMTGIGVYCPLNYSLVYRNGLVGRILYCPLNYSFISINQMAKLRELLMIPLSEDDEDCVHQHQKRHIVALGVTGPFEQILVMSVEVG
jgi:hypothetical protein